MAVPPADAEILEAEPFSPLLALAHAGVILRTSAKSLLDAALKKTSMIMASPPGENFYLLLFSTSVIGAFFGFLIFHFIFVRRQSREGEEEEDDGVVKTKKKKSEVSETDDAMRMFEDNREEGAYVPAIIRGRFNKEVNANLRRYNDSVGKLIEMNDDDENEEDEEEKEGGNASTDEEEDESDLENMNDLESISENDEIEADKDKNGADPASVGMSTLGEQEMMKRLGKLHGKLATAKLRKESIRIQAEMSQKQRDEENKIRAEQLESILSLMMADKDKFGIDTKEELDEQMDSLYNI